MRLSKSNVVSVKKLADPRLAGTINVNVDPHPSRSRDHHSNFVSQGQPQYALSGTQVGIKPVPIQQQYEAQLDQLILGDNHKHQAREFVEKYFQTKQNHEMMLRATDPAQKVRTVRQKEALAERVGAKVDRGAQVGHSPPQ